MATTAPKTIIGKMDCLCCGHEIPVKQAENGTINAACPWCDFPAYAKKGSEAHRIITGKLKGQPAPAASKPAPPAAKPTAPPPPAPAPIKKPGGVGIFAGL